LKEEKEAVWRMQRGRTKKNKERKGKKKEMMSTTVHTDTRRYKQHKQQQQQCMCNQKVVHSWTGAVTESAVK